MKAWHICILPLATTYPSLLPTVAAFGVPSKQQQHQQQQQIDRRRAISSCIYTTLPLIATLSPSPAFSDDDTTTTAQKIAFEKRNRNSNKNAIIREDFWYMFNRVPPRKLDPNVLPKDDPKWNAWGTCAPGSDNTSNSCTYVPLKLRSAGYSKYAFLISLASREYQTLGKILEKEKDSIAWDEAASLVDQGGSGQVPSAVCDAIRKMVLLATALLTSPNYSGPNIDLFVARYYVNEVAYAASQVKNAIEARDVATARDAWEYGKDSWNSYYVVVNRAIVPKVGEQFESIMG
uniref:Uncharacterized protein n=1 Tax=Helicotheca tamesis TaxID=374047 RepID=A0A7S2HEF0_9STRA|mmetsp:Transcript_17206/g.23654  ORF Transcript_17206/g.23654 Transcript_17206/m.23654 type:complete len:291 (+) Transcript_17206:29-901(+)|eukprot:CAMPEP_0185724010 /NCGR_PEP_ID=MMETSP1171-20130828/636_1 /TAXON_ID=374046 /ORGANISM="Helicotheca tamensis, Strain CCMP826" /LENGTH=290 /DNA_ID=CAMNT_0028391781 /DNA_START=17 /DNA_END=889 /DNA_ORIENTATION=+